MEKLYNLLANHVCMYHGSNDKGKIKQEYALESLMKHMPSGSGIDSGTKLLIDESSEYKLVFQVDYHHMNSNGYYCGWSSRKIVITPSLTDEFKMNFEDEDYSGVDCQDSLDEHPEDSDCEEDCQNEDCFIFDNTEFIQDSTGDYLADTYRYALTQEYQMIMADYEPTVLTIHGELVR